MSLAAAALLTVGSAAWACTGTHTGKVWLCPTGTPSCASPGTTSFVHATNADSSASGLDAANTAFTLYYGTGTSMNCGGSIFQLAAGGNAVFTSNGTKAWSGKGPVVIPTATGTYFECAVDNVSGTGSNHSSFTVT